MVLEKSKLCCFNTNMKNSVKKLKYTVKCSTLHTLYKVYVRYVIGIKSNIKHTYINLNDTCKITFDNEKLHFL